MCVWEDKSLSLMISQQYMLKSLHVWDFVSLIVIFLYHFWLVQSNFLIKKKKLIFQKVKQNYHMTLQFYS